MTMWWILGGVVVVGAGGAIWYMNQNPNSPAANALADSAADSSTPNTTPAAIGITNPTSTPIAS